MNGEKRWIYLKKNFKLVQVSKEWRFFFFFELVGLMLLVACGRREFGEMVDLQVLSLILKKKY